MDQLASTSRIATSRGLNQGQQEAADGFFQFLFSKDKEMIISGPGGVGKTHLMGSLIDVTMPRYLETCKMMGMQPEFDSVEMTATTNKAAEQLAQATRRPTSTIAAFCDLKVQEDWKTGVTKLSRKTNWKVHQRKVIFIDECSMIDTPLDRHVHEATLNCKIVYVGDHCQLAPVLETLSPIYRRGLPFYQLTEPMRTGVPELLAVNQQLRNTVETGEFKPIQIIPGIIDHLDDEQMQAAIAEDFAEQTDDARILAYTNRRVIEFNDFIRGIRSLPSHFTVGERLVCANAVHLKGAVLSVESEVTIMALADQTEKIFVDEGVELEVQRATICTPIGQMFTDVPLPVDHEHFINLIKYYAREKNWERHFFLKNGFPDLRPHDASTVYKAQGSTYGTTYIDLGNISTCNNPNQVARMLYVAFTRSRNRVCLYGDLAPKYGGLVF